MAESSQGNKCVLHLGDGDNRGSIIPFTEETLARCKAVLSARQKNFVSSKYSKIVSLPDVLDINFGYHKDCYSNFTAIKLSLLESAIDKNDSNQTTIESVCEEQSSSSCRSTRSLNPSISSNPRGIFNRVCLFCDKECFKHNGVKQKLIPCETKNFERNIFNYAVLMRDEEMLKKVQGVDFVAKEVRYHRLCRLQYQKRAECVKSKEAIKQSKWKNNRDMHSLAFDGICAFVEENILKKEEVYLLHEIHTHYISLLEELNATDVVNESSFRRDHLEKKLFAFFKDKLAKAEVQPNRMTIIFKSTMSVENAASRVVGSRRSLRSEVRNIAFTLRKLIFESKSHPLPDKIKLKNIVHGEANIPELLTTFLMDLICGPDPRNSRSEGKVIKITSISEDIIYAVTNGRTKPSKHLQLGLAMKSMTGSRKVVEVLNRLGHSVSYNTVEEIETELTFTATEDNRITPNGMITTESLSTGVAFDNYDRFVETLSGKDTLHDTVGIAYQDIVPFSESAVIEDVHQNPTSNASNKRRRTFQASGLDIEPYRKKPKMQSSPLLPLEDDRRNVVPANLDDIKIRDTIWMLLLAFDVKDTPMWVGWNSKMIEDPRALQKIWYLPQINISPTSLPVVAQTLRTSQSIAAECGQKYIMVTYDLAIAKLALQIQSEESPTFDNVFIQLGAFHIEMSFFKALGKFIEESGGPHVLIASNLLAGGSLSGVISGKHFNRCKRLHPLLACAMEILHFEAFLKEQEPVAESVISELTLLSEATPNTAPLCISAELMNLLSNYTKFCKETEEGVHGATPKYWMMYIQFIRLYHEFSRSLRTGDYQLYIHCLPKMATLFFAFNHQNYSRWLMRFHDNLLRREESHPGIETEFQKGGFSIRRTSKNFSRSPIDLSLEQSVNADAGSKLTGITAFTNSVSARQRWAQSHFIRTSVISNLLDRTGLRHKEDVSKEVQPHRIRKDAESLKSVVDEIKTSLNPFEIDKSDLLFNIVTGKAASEATTSFLLNVQSIGETRRDSFVGECSDDPSRFEKSIRKEKISTFASDGVKTKRTRADGKVVELKMERDLMGRVLCIAVDRKIDMGLLLQYPLTPIPLSLCHIDGTMHKTDKSSLFVCLEHRVTTEPPKFTDCIIIDGFFFLHLLGDVPATFGNISRHIFQKLCRLQANRIDIVFDITVSPSIKDSERDRRDSLLGRKENYAISGSAQQRPTDFLKALRNDNFKEALVAYIVESWNDDSLACILNNKTVHATCNDVCYSYSVESSKVIRRVVDSLSSNHEEADSRMIFHLSKIQPPANVVIRTSDTDVMAIALGNMDRISSDTHVWLEVGVQGKNTLRYVDISLLYTTLGPLLSRAVPAFHAFTGCDYTAAFSRKGKKRPFVLLEQSLEAQRAFASLGQNEIVDELVFIQLEKFVSQMYGKKKLLLNEARLEAFLKIYKPTSARPLDKLKGMDASSLPPCTAVLRQKIARTNLVCGIWTNAVLGRIATYSPEGNGWVLEDGKYKPLWFVGDQSPTSLDEIIPVDDLVSVDDDDDIDDVRNNEDDTTDSGEDD